MNKSIFRTISLVIIVMFIFTALTSAQELKPIKLLEPQLNSGKLLMQALKARMINDNFKVSPTTIIIPLFYRCKLFLFSSPWGTPWT